jgi:hypothetical protein
MLSSDFSCEDEKIKKFPTLHIYDSDKFLISAEISFGTEKKFRYDIGQKVVEKRKSKYYQRIFSPSVRNLTGVFLDYIYFNRQLLCNTHTNSKMCALYGKVEYWNGRYRKTENS